MGNLFGSGGGGTANTSEQSEPWAAQIPYFQDMMQRGGQLFNAQWGMPYFQGDQEAGLSGTQQDYINAARGQAGAIPGFGNIAYNNAAQASGALPGGMDLASRYAAGNFGVTGPHANLEALYGRAGVDPTQEIANRAGIMANNPHLSGMIDSASRDVTRNLYENQLPTLNMAAMRGGNLNSSRAGAAEAIATRGAADRMADISSTMRGDAWQQGVGLGADTWSQGLQSQLGATGQQGNLYGQDINSRLGGLGSLGSMIGQGMGVAQGAQGMGDARLDTLGRAGITEQAGAQAGLNNNYNRWLGTQNYPWQLLQNYGATIGGGNLGGQSQGVAPAGGSSQFQQLAGLGLGIAGMFMN